MRASWVQRGGHSAVEPCTGARKPRDNAAFRRWRRGAVARKVFGL